LPGQKPEHSNDQEASNQREQDADDRRLDSVDKPVDPQGEDDNADGDPREALSGHGPDYRRARVSRPSGPGNGDTFGLKFALVSTDGEIFDSSESAVPDWSAGDTVIAAGNVHYRVVSVIPVELAAD